MSFIENEFPGWEFEEDFAETDELWVPDLRESDGAMDVRAKKALDAVFRSDGNTYLSISTHSGFIGSVLRGESCSSNPLLFDGRGRLLIQILVLGHRPFGLGTGQAIPVLVKAELVEGTPPVTEPEPWFPVELCDSPPVA